MSKRIPYIDTVKGIGIILVILGHTYQVPQLLHDVVYSFHMPLFFVVSGYVYNETKYNQYSIKDYLLKRTKDYLIPYYVFAFINLGLVIAWNTLLLHTSISAGKIWSYFCGILYCYSDMLHMPNCTPIWFLMSLFFASILFWLALKRLKNRVWVAALSSMAVGYTLSLVVDVPMPLKLDTVFMAMFFMYIGHLMKQQETLKFPIYTAVVGMVMGGIVGVHNPVGMNENEYGNLLLFLSSSLLSIYSIMLLCCKSFISHSRILRLLGRHSILIVGFNYFLRDAAVELYYLIPVVKRYPVTWFSSFTITLLLAILLVWFWDVLQKKLSYLKKDCTPSGYLQERKT